MTTLLLQADTPAGRGNVDLFKNSEKTLKQLEKFVYSVWSRGSPRLGEAVYSVFYTAHKVQIGRIAGCPIHKVFITLDADVTPHLDKHDAPGSLIAWFHDGEVPRSSASGGFCLYDLCLAIRPRQYTLAYVASKSISHGSVAPLSNSGFKRYGVALTNNQGEVTRMVNQLADPKLPVSFCLERRRITFVERKEGGVAFDAQLMAEADALPDSP